MITDGAAACESGFDLDVFRTGMSRDLTKILKRVKALGKQLQNRKERAVQPESKP